MGIGGGLVTPMEPRGWPKPPPMVVWGWFQPPLWAHVGGRATPWCLRGWPKPPSMGTEDGSTALMGPRGWLHLNVRALEDAQSGARPLTPGPLPKSPRRWSRHRRLPRSRCHPSGAARSLARKRVPACPAHCRTARRHHGP
jgi:hypothetical protein